MKCKCKGFCKRKIFFEEIKDLEGDKILITIKGFIWNPFVVVNKKDFMNLFKKPSDKKGAEY